MRKSPIIDTGPCHIDTTPDIDINGHFPKNLSLAICPSIQENLGSIGIEENSIPRINYLLNNNKLP